MFNKFKKFAAIILACTMFSTSTVSVFAESENFSNNVTIMEERVIEGKLSNSSELGVEDINEQLKNFYPYGEIVEVQDSEFGKIYYVDSEFHKTRKKRTAWDVLDFVMAGASWADFFGNPSLASFGWAALDTAALLPFLPSSAYVRKGGKILFDMDEVKKFAKTSKGKETIAKALKVFTITVTESSAVKKAVKKLSPEAKKGYEAAIKGLKSGDLRGLNDHALKGDRKGQRAVDIKGLGSGRGQGRLIYEKNKDGSIELVEILTKHDY